MKYLKFSTLVLATISLLITSCEDQVYPELEPASPVLSVDAWINNLPGSQVIKLMETQTYFDASSPPGVSGATVTVLDDQGKLYLFIEDDKKPGSYLWNPLAGEVFGAVGRKYTLTIQTNGETFQASSYMGRVPPIDSLVFYREKRVVNKDSLTRAEFWATDPVGPGDAYWIRSFKNGILLNKPNELNIAYDAGFSIGAQTDGVPFIPPVRRGINPNDQNEDGSFVDPFLPGDSLHVQLSSITKAAFNYLSEVAVQIDRPGGFAELFAKPLANVSTNILNVNAEGSKAVGFFNVSAISTAGKRYKKK